MYISNQQQVGIWGIACRRAYQAAEETTTSKTLQTGFRVYVKEDCSRFAWLVLNLIGREVEIDGQKCIYGRKSFRGFATRMNEKDSDPSNVLPWIATRLQSLQKKPESSSSEVVTSATKETELVETTVTPAPKTSAYMDIEEDEVVELTPKKPEVKTSAYMDIEEDEVVELTSKKPEVTTSAFMEVEDEVTVYTPAPQVGQPEDAAAPRPATPLVDADRYSHEDIDSSISVSEDEEELDPRDIAMDRIDTLGEAINWSATPTPLKYALTRTYNTVKGTDNHPQFINDLRTLGYHISRGEVVAQRNI